MYKIYIYILIFISLFQNSIAQDNFATFVPNALASGFGGSYITNIHDPAILFWNPGGMGFSTADKISINTNNSFSFNNICFTKFYAPYNSIGFGLSRIIDNNDFEDVATFSYSRRFTQYGGNINYGKINNNVDDFLSFGVGFLLRPAINRNSFYRINNSPTNLFFNPLLYNKFAFGVMIHNIPLSDTFSKHVIRIGSSFKLADWGPNFNITHHLIQGENSTHFGAGFNITPNFLFCAGTKNFNLRDLAFGGSSSFGKFSTDIIYSSKKEKISLSVIIQLTEKSTTIAKKYIEKGTEKIRVDNFHGALDDFEKSLAYNQNNKKIIYLNEALKKKIINDNKKVDSLLVQAIKFQNKKWYVSATITYKKILRLDKNNKKVIKNLYVLKPHIINYINSSYTKGVQYFKFKNWEKSKKTLEDILLINEHHKGAIKYLAKIDSVNSYLSKDYYYRGLGYYKQRHLLKAQNAFNRVIKLNPNHKEAKFYKNKIEDEIQSYSGIIQTLLNQAHHSKNKGNYQLASSKYNEILNINKDYTKASTQLNLLNIYINDIVKRKFKKAKKLFNGEKYRESQIELNDILSLQSNHKGAYTYINKIRELKKEQVNESYKLALQYFNNNNLNDAKKEIEKILLINPEHYKAIKLEEKISGFKRLDEMQSRAMRLFRNGAYIEAKKAFNLILEIDRNHLIAKSYIKECDIKINRIIAELFNSGMTFYTSGNYEAAIRDWNRILNIEPHHQSTIEYKKRAQERFDALKKLK